MKILFDFQDTIGGAPRSHLEHAKALAQQGHKIIALISTPENISFFEKTNFEIHTLPAFKNNNLVQLIINLYRYVTLVNKIMPDLIYSNRSVQIQYLSVISDITGVPILCGRAGGTGVSIINKINKDRHYVVYSKESIEEFLRMGFDRSYLHLITNRIPEIYGEIEKSKNPVGIVTILLIGNIKKDTLNGLVWFFKFLYENLPQIESKLKVLIAGNILDLDKYELNRYEEYINKIQNEYSHKCNIIKLGWVDDIKPLIKNADICLGKGRSIIQSIMYGKVGFVISENNGLFECNQNNYEYLYHTNFTGRRMNFSQKDIDVFLDYISVYNAHTSSNDIAVRAKLDYSIDYLPYKINNVINCLKKSDNKRRLLSILRILKIYYFKAKKYSILSLVYFNIKVYI